MKERIDKMMVTLGLVKTRSQAAQLIKEGVVYYFDEQVKKPSLKVDDEGIEVRKDVLYVGRGAHKVEGPLNLFKIDVNGLVVADVGACTGGFTDYVLKNGATKVYAIDVGHDQLAQELVEDERVENYEGVNIKHPFELEEPADLAVVDLSYISLRLTLKNIFNLVKETGDVLALVKPQFEVGKENIGKNGIVKSSEVKKEMLEGLYAFCSENNFFLKGFCLSPIKGKTGNEEYFFYFDKTLSEHKISIEDILKGIE